MTGGNANKARAKAGDEPSKPVKAVRAAPAATASAADADPIAGPIMSPIVGPTGVVMTAESVADWVSALAYLNARPNAETLRPSEIDATKVFRPERMVALMEALGNPQAEFRSVHVAGSKGKGSVCEMTASALESCGYTVGLYTSPHLVDVRERIRLNQAPISREEFAVLLAKAARAGESLPRKLGQVTYFELITAVAFLHFVDQAVDIAVIEVGLGGRLDATNVITPEVSALASIHMEHADLLGGTLELIAREKAGIIKPGVPAISLPQTPEVVAVFREAAAQHGTTLAVIGQELDFSHRFETSPELGTHARVVLTTPRSTFEHLAVPLRGEHQAFNCGLVLAILDALRGKGFDTPETLVANGLARTPLNGRLEQVHSQPRVIVDGAHTPESIQALIKTVGSHMRYDSLVVVFGCAADKDVSGMLRKLALGADKIIFTRASGSHRAIDPRELQRRFAEHAHKMTQVAPSVRDAINLAALAVSRGDLVIVTGSFLIAGEAKRLFIEKQQAARPRGEALPEPKPSPKPTPPAKSPPRRP